MQFIWAQEARPQFDTSEKEDWDLFVGVERRDTIALRVLVLSGFGDRGSLSLKFRENFSIQRERQVMI